MMRIYRQNLLGVWFKSQCIWCQLTHGSAYGYTAPSHFQCDCCLCGYLKSITISPCTLHNHIAMLQFWCIWCWLISWLRVNFTNWQSEVTNSSLAKWLNRSFPLQNWQHLWHSCILVSKFLLNFKVEYVLSVEKHSVSYQNIPATKCFCWPAGVLWDAG